MSLSPLCPAEPALISPAVLLVLKGREMRNAKNMVRLVSSLGAFRAFTRTRGRPWVEIETS